MASLVNVLGIKRLVIDYVYMSGKCYPHKHGEQAPCSSVSLIRLFFCRSQFKQARVSLKRSGIGRRQTSVEDVRFGPRMSCFRLNA